MAYIAVYSCGNVLIAKEYKGFVMAKKMEISEEIKDKAVEMLRKGETHRTIAKELKISTSTVSKVRERCQLERFYPANAMVRSDAVAWIQKKKKGFTDVQLAKKLGCIPKEATDVIRHLAHHDGYNLVFKNGLWQMLAELPQAPKLTIKRFVGEEFTFGLLSDTHLCNNRTRLDVLEAAYDLFAKRKIDTVFHAGNIIDGEGPYNRYEITQHGVHAQACEVATKYPYRKGIKTLFITGDCHEGWYQKREGIRIGFYIQKVCEDHGRTDMEWVGHLEKDIVIEQPHGKTRIRLMHPGGGSAYALSYSGQKMVESFQGGDKPHVLIIGHFHKYDVNYAREIITIQPGCVCDQTDFMRKKKLGAHVGFVICTVGRRLDGTLGTFKHEWYPFYDAKYHQRAEEYQLNV